MDFGLFVPRPAIVREPPAAVAGKDPWYQFSLETTVAAEEVGFSIALVAQRFLGPDLESWMQSAALAEATERIRIMTAVHPIFWSPQVAAKMGASIERISAGRWDMNLVTGWYQEEQQKYGGLELGGTQYARSEEFVEVMRRLWREESVTFEGEFYNLADVSLFMTPSQMPSVYLTTRSEAGLTAAARTCDWWFVPCGPDFRKTDENLAATKRSILDMRERAERAGRSVRFCINAFLLHDEDESAVYRHAEEIEAYGLSDPPTHEKMTNRSIQAAGLGLGLLGGRNRILDRLAQLEEMGIEMVLLRLEPMLAGIRDLGEHIIPLASKSHARVGASGA